MRCTHCDYPLWSIAARACPECGGAFAATDFDFVPGEVRFCCPHCRHPYLGTGERGHPEPSFTCVRCGGAVAAADMVVVPRLGMEEHQARGIRMCMTLDTFLAATPGARLRAVAAEIDATPPGRVAHRFGDYVFTYHGATLGAADPALWTMVMTPAPEANVLGPDTPVVMTAASMMIEEHTLKDLPALLVAQNALRATLGLPPLPDLVTVTHASPGVAPTAPAPAPANGEPPSP